LPGKGDKLVGDELCPGLHCIAVQALFDEVDVSVIHNLVLDHFVTFDDLLKAIDTWQVTESENERWVREMASFEVGRSHEESADCTR
jgi:hypothetical protein